MRLLLSYFDQNEEFGALLPRSGTGERFVRSNNDADWALVRLDQAIEYRSNIYSHLLLQSRWQECPIGGTEPTSVHVVLTVDVPRIRDGFTVDRERHVAWGMTERIPDHRTV